MSGKFVRASKYRHVFGQAVKRELQYENIKVTNNAWDSNIIKTNGKFISVNWNASGGGAFAVVPVEEVGKAPDQVPLFRGHTAQVLDTDFDPFDDHRVASVSDDSKIAIWEIPKDYSFHNYLNEDGEPKDIKPIKIISGHTKKVGHVLFHPVAKDILATSSLDYSVRIWDVETGDNIFTLKHPDMVTSMSFSYNGSHLATVSRDKKLRVWDIRAEKVVSEGSAHQGAKNQRVVWLGNSDRLATTGFSRLSDRQIGIWDAFNLEKGDLGGFYTVDQSSGILMPFFDDSNKILYVAGKGDGNIRYYEFQNDELFELSEFQSTDPQRGFAIAPKRFVDVKSNEVLKCYKTVIDQTIEPVSFYVPRRSEEFQDDIYPDAPSDQPALTAEEWRSGKDVDGPILVSMRSIYEGTAPTFHKSTKPTEFKPVTKGDEKLSMETKTDEKPQSSTTTTTTSSTSTTTASSPSIKVPIVNNTVYSKSSTPTTLSDSLKSNSSVDKLLQKSSNIDQDNAAEDPSRDTSGWDEEDERPATPELSVERKESVLTNPIESPPKQDGPKNSKPEPTSIATDVINKITKKENIKLEDKTKKQEENNIHSSTHSVKSMGLKQSVETLSNLVLKLEQIVENLTASNLEKDERLKALEEKIEALINEKK